MKFTIRIFFFIALSILVKAQTNYSSEVLSSRFTQSKDSSPSFLASPRVLYSQPSDDQIADFLVGFWSEVKNGKIIDHDEVRPCISPNEELSAMTVDLISNAVDYSKEKSQTFEKLETMLTNKFPALRDGFSNRIIENCPDHPEIAKHVTDFFNDFINNKLPELSFFWPFLSSKVRTLFNSFAKDISQEEYKHAIVDAYRSVSQDELQMIVTN